MCSNVFDTINSSSSLCASVSLWLPLSETARSSYRSWCRVKALAKPVREVRLIGEAHLDRDLRERQIGLEQHRQCVPEAQLLVMSMNARACRPLEGAARVEDRHTGDSRERVERHARLKVARQCVADRLGHLAILPIASLAPWREAQGKRRTFVVCGQCLTEHLFKMQARGDVSICETGRDRLRGEVRGVWKPPRDRPGVDQRITQRSLNGQTDVAFAIDVPDLVGLSIAQIQAHARARHSANVSIAKRESAAKDDDHARAVAALFHGTGMIDAVARYAPNQERVGAEQARRLQVRHPQIVPDREHSKNV